jgi:hypothetical protein
MKNVPRKNNLDWLIIYVALVGPTKIQRGLAQKIVTWAERKSMG